MPKAWGIRIFQILAFAFAAAWTAIMLPMYYQYALHQVRTVSLPQDAVVLVARLVFVAVFDALPAMGALVAALWARRRH